MQMRRPTTIFACMANVREDFAARDALANFQRIERPGREMPVESKEFDARRGLMMKDDDWTVIKRRGIVRQRVNRRVERSGNGSARFNE